MRATEICGEVFCEIWAVFLTVWLVVRNATLEHSRNAAFTLSKCGISDSEVWYLFTPSPSFFLTTTSFFLFSSYLISSYAREGKFSLSQSVL